MVASDLDRTLTDAQLRVVPAARAQLTRVRAQGVKTVLITGRTASELARRNSLLTEFDAVVAESGASLLLAGRAQPLVGPSQALTDLHAWLTRRRIAHRSGAASISIATAHRKALERWPRIRELTAHTNRDRIDVTLKGCDKGTGLRKALWAIGEPRRMTLVLGDARNDLSAFAQAGYGVAVGNAEAALKAVAHEVAPGYGGRAVANFLRRRFIGEDQA